MEQATPKQDVMHGSIYVLLKRYVENKHGYSGWINLAEKANLSRTNYQMHEMYPTSEIFDLLGASASVSGVSMYEEMEKFGEFLVPDLLLMYNKYIQPEWRTYDMLLHTEESMHRAVKTEDSRTSPPLLLVTKKGSNQLIVDYYSKRRMAGLAVGIIKGIASYYHESDLVKVTSLTPADAERVQIQVNFAY